MAHEFLGRGWSFPISVDNGHVVDSSEDDKVRQAIEIILRTAPGERVARPDFGCGIHDLVFETLGDDVLWRLVGAVRTSLAMWEPRIDVLDVSTRQVAEQPNRILIEIDYRVRSTNSRLNLVFPFYVQ